MTVVAVIVTFNRKLMLQEMLRSFNKMTRTPDFIIIVDNNSSDGTGAFLASIVGSAHNVIPIFLNTNVGGAGGYHIGIERGCELGADWVWTLDDDCVPQPDALEKLIDFMKNYEKGHSAHIGFLASRVNWTDGSLHLMNKPGVLFRSDSIDEFDKGIKPIKYASFVSILINRNAIEMVGLPIKEFFIYFDDVEYTRRITSSGFAAYYVPASIVTHVTATNRGLSLDSFLLSPAYIGKYQYMIRNLVAVNRRESLGWLRETCRLVYIFVYMVRNGASIKFACVVFLAGLRGLFMNYEKCIKQVLPKSNP